MQRQAKKRSGDAGGAGGTKRAVTPRSAFIVLACTAIAEYFAFYLRLADAGAKAGIPHGGYVMCALICGVASLATTAGFGLLLFAERNRITKNLKQLLITAILLGLAMGEPVYVCGKDMAANTVTVGPENALYSSMLLAEDMNWISIPQLKQPMRVKAKTRYRQAEQWAAVYPEQHGRVRLEFDAPQRAVTVGQAVVLYDGDVVVGGGTICQAPPTKR